MISFKTGILKTLADKMKTSRKLEITVYASLIVAVILLYLISVGTGEAPDNNKRAVDDDSVLIDSERELEARLAKTLSSIRGAGKVEVMITYDTGAQLVPAMSIDKQKSVSDGQNQTLNETESSRPATVSDGGKNEAIVLTEKKPMIRGVIVIAQGAADISVQLDLQRAVQTVLGVTVDVIDVFEMTIK